MQDIEWIKDNLDYYEKLVAGIERLGPQSIGKGKVREQHLTDLGACIYEHDRYLEELGTLYLVQYKLATNQENATAWYYFFNHFNMTEFSKEDFILQLQKYIAEKDDIQTYHHQEVVLS